MHIAQNWRIRQARYALQGVRCEKCGEIVFPARAVCPHCEASQMSDSEAESRELLTRESFNIASSNVAVTDFAQAAR